MVGIVIGVGSVVLLMGIGAGVKKDVTRQIDDLGANTAILVPGKLDKSGQPNVMSTLGITTLTDNDVASLNNVEGIKKAIPLMFVFGSVDYQKQSYPGVVFGTTAGIFDIRPFPVEKGRLFRPEDELQPVCVLANAPKEQMFGNADAIGKTIMIQGVAFKVIGVMEKEEPSLFGQFSFANVIYVPLKYSRTKLEGGQLNRILLHTDYTKDPKKTLSHAKNIILANHKGREDFGIVTPTQLLGAIFKVFDIVQAMIIGIGAISLVVAGVGIMNIMLVTVTERTREIGIRKTVGARKADIFAQFLTEALALCFAGGLVGTVGAIMICKIAAMYSPLKPVVTLPAIGLAFGVCLTVGLSFGVAPAMRAARQDPIQALRWE